MTIAYWCVLIAALLPYAAVGVAKRKMNFRKHNGEPRAWEATLTGIGARAHAAHLNSFEAFPLFAAAVIIAVLCMAPQAVVDAIAVAFILTRVAYIGCYVSDRASLRSIVWMIGFGLCIALFMVAAFSR